jgi:hypothetical protein
MHMQNAVSTKCQDMQHVLAVQQQLCPSARTFTQLRMSTVRKCCP